ncbi:serine/threonine kinase 4 [Blastocladiella britannica]|nr:serine/threonine kinase 4 [Blastocladiella britannica]
MEIPTLILSDAERNGPLLDSFAVDELIGEGSYGHVYRGTHLRTAGTVAVKRVPIDNDLPSLMQEISMMQACDSPAIVQLHHFYVEPHYLWMVMEFCAAGSVADVMKATGRTLSEPIIAVIARDTLLGLSYLHSHGKLHRDIKAGNILLDDEGRGKLADFGVAGQLTDAATRRNTIIGTPYWYEVIQEIGYTTKADLWSLGITCIEMAEGHPPNHAVHPMRAIFMIPSRPPPRLAAADQWTPDFHAFLALLLIKNPDVRPTADTVLDDPRSHVEPPC